MSSIKFLLVSSLLSQVVDVTAKQLLCNDEIPIPEYRGTKVTSLTAKEVRGYKDWGAAAMVGLPFNQENPVDLCNVTLSYTHPEMGDNINVYVWLPLDNWNGNFLGQGGGGWAAGMEGALGPPVALGYASANTDAGHSFHVDPVQATFSARDWAIPSPGNVDWTLLQDFASVSLDDMANLAKGVVSSFYGKAPRYSYWNGNYNGILALAPAVNWDSFIVAELWGQVMMRKENYYPSSCEWEAIRNSAIEACDELDGVKDGVVAAANLCNFDALSVVGQKYNCSGETRHISEAAATIANAAWEGPKRNGKLEWFGLNHEAPFSSATSSSGGLLQTICDEDNKNCTGSPFPISKEWVQVFLAKNLGYDVSDMSEEDFFGFLHLSRQWYSSIMGSADPDLSEFKAAGGRMITWHGLADELIFPNGTANYYERVLALDSKAKDFYRYFEAPGVLHCGRGVGAFPKQAFNSLVQWVESETVPDTLDAETTLEPTRSRILCVYPQVAAYRGGNPDDASSYECADTFGTKKAV
ncbi:hypothetical protein LTR37_003625 [Vermiconidia calcicola]|uniref:Uncharacterized protein n=1 Tax=Vermiconidia calcicola TaxID=1690605 RepID=A0ACC3NPJ1_9PEZI|nr:hypothetical protein LTR37_003625 [Vermiconidia calcicola]